MTAIRNVLPLAALLGALSLSAAAAAQPRPAAQPPAAPSAAPLPPPPAPPGAAQQPPPPAPGAAQPGAAPLPPPPAQPPAATGPQQPAPPGAAPSPAQPPPGYTQPPPGYTQPPPLGYGGQPPPGYGYPPPGYYPYIPYAAPRTLPYRDNAPPPPGYRIETRARRKLMIAGVSVAGGAYLLTALTAGTIISEGSSESGELVPLLIPVAGPFIALGTWDEADLGSDDTSPAAVILLLDGIAQVIGAVLFGAGLYGEEKIWVRDDIPVTKAAAQRPPAVARPEILVGPGGGGLRMKF